MEIYTYRPISFSEARKYSHSCRHSSWMINSHVFSTRLQPLFYWQLCRRMGSRIMKVNWHKNNDWRSETFRREIAGKRHTANHRFFRNPISDFHGERKAIRHILGMAGLFYLTYSYMSHVPFVTTARNVLQKIYRSECFLMCPESPCHFFKTFCFVMFVRSVFVLPFVG